jgi:hypothetical protein
LDDFKLPTIADTNAGNCGTFMYTISITSGPNPSLISISGDLSSSPNITFAKSNNLADAGVYNFIVTARYQYATNWTVSDSGTYTYVDPCLSTLITTTNYNSSPLIRTSSTGIPSAGTSVATLWKDTLTASINNGT